MDRVARDEAGRRPEALLRVEDLRVVFRTPAGPVHAVDGLSFQVGRGEAVAIIGESGSGKTVTSRALMGLLPRTASVSGSARLLDAELIGASEAVLRKHRGCDIAMVFQDPARSLNPTMKIGHQITEAIRVHMKELSRSEARERAVELLRRVRLPSPEARYHEYPHQLSGGMRQRVMIAIAVACNPKLLIADEATTALDVTTQAQIMALLLELQEEFDMGLIIVSHDMGLAATYAQRTMVMYAGRSVEQARTAELFAEVRMPYTRVLLDAVPKLDLPPHSQLPVVRPGTPDLMHRTPACSFAPRCPRALDRCSQEAPALEWHGDHAWACFNPHAPNPAGASA